MSDGVKVLQVIGGLGVGGAETWLMEVLRHWRASGGNRMDFLLTGGQPDHFDADAEALGATLHYMPYGRKFLPRFMRDFRALLGRERYDAIHDHSDYASGWRLLMAGGALPPVRVAHVHNPWLHISANYAISSNRRLAAAGGKVLVKRLATHVCGTSGEILRQYGFEPGGTRPRAEVVHCGFRVDKFNADRTEDRRRIISEFGFAEDAKLVLAVGRLDRALQYCHPQNHKNSWFALNVARAAHALDPSVCLIMAGEGPSRDAMLGHVRDWGLGSDFHLPGIRDDVPALMRAANVLLFPSAQEGLGMAAVEAQAAGLPVLASTAVPREAVAAPEAYHALALTEPVEAWARTLLEIAAAPRPDRLACRAALQASAFSVESSAASLEAIYRGAR